MRGCRRTPRAYVLALACWAILAASAPGAVWTNTAADGTWTDNRNWAGGAYPDGVDAQAWFTNNLTAVRTVTLDKSVTVGEVNLSSGTGASSRYYKIAGTNTITLQVNAGEPAIRQIWAHGAGTVYGYCEVNCNLNLTSMTYVTNASNYGLTFRGAIRGNGGIRYQPGGKRLYITTSAAATNTFTGGTVHMGGTLHMSSGDALGTGLLTMWDTGVNFLSLDFPGQWKNNTFRSTFGAPILFVRRQANGRYAFQFNGSSYSTLYLDKALTSTNALSGGRAIRSLEWEFINMTGSRLVVSGNNTNLFFLPGYGWQIEAFDATTAFKTNTVVVDGPHAFGATNHHLVLLAMTRVNNSTLRFIARNGRLVTGEIRCLAYPSAGNNGHNAKYEIGSEGASATSVFSGPLKFNTFAPILATNVTAFLSASNGCTSVFSGIISDSAAAPTNRYAVVLKGGGTVILNGASTYKGPTRVLDVTLGGTGTLNSAVTMDPGTTLAPGHQGVGTLTVNSNFTFATGGVYNWDGNGARGDLVVVNGTLTLPDTATVNASVPAGTKPAAFSRLFTANRLAGASDLTLWTLNGASGYVDIIGTNVVLRPPRGTVIVLQ